MRQSAPDIREHASSLGAEPVGSHPVEFAAFVKAPLTLLPRIG